MNKFMNSRDNSVSGNSAGFAKTSSPEFCPGHGVETFLTQSSGL